MPQKFNHSVKRPAIKPLSRRKQMGKLAREKRRQLANQHWNESIATFREESSGWEKLGVKLRWSNKRRPIDRTERHDLLDRLKKGGFDETRTVIRIANRAEVERQRNAALRQIGMTVQFGNHSLAFKRALSEIVFSVVEEKLNPYYQPTELKQAIRFLKSAQLRDFFNEPAMKETFLQWEQIQRKVEQAEEKISHYSRVINQPTFFQKMIKWVWIKNKQTLKEKKNDLEMRQGECESQITRRLFKMAQEWKKTREERNGDAP